MASYFGEVIQPSSRAFWNDEDDDGNFFTQENTNFVVAWIEPEPARFEKCILIEGDMANDFASKCLLHDATIACRITNERDKKVVATIFHHFNAGLCFCTISENFDLTQAGSFVKLIAPYLKKSKSIYAVTSDHITHFKSQDEIDTPAFLKCLRSQKAKKDDKNLDDASSSLNQPNIVTGVCAGALTYAEVTSLHCIMYILYTDTFSLDSKNSSPLADLFSNLLGRSIPKFSATISGCFKKGNLYL